MKHVDDVNHLGGVRINDFWFIFYKNDPLLGHYVSNILALFNPVEY